MKSLEAQRVIESLRNGLPPDGYICHFTVGRKSELSQLMRKFRMGNPGPLLLKANYGAGKTHLLRFIREYALENSYAVSLITLDAKSAVRFNKMDQIFGATMRSIELPERTGKGPRVLFSELHRVLTSSCQDQWQKSSLEELSNEGDWAYSTLLKSPGLFIGIRAWIIGTNHRLYYRSIPEQVEDWICAPWNYKASWLRKNLVSNMRIHFNDRRSNFDGAFNFTACDYRQSWDALADLDLLSKLVGLRGFVLLVDEFEDVIYNLKGRNVQIDAFGNLFRLFRGDFPGFSFYAVTPGFERKCMALLIKKGRFDYEFSQFLAIPSFELNPLETGDLQDMAIKIMDVHAVAYDWIPQVAPRITELSSIVDQASKLRIQDRTRYAVRQIVKFLDDLLEESL